MELGAHFIREATPADEPAIIAITRRAFDRDDEADVARRLRDDGDVVATLVAESGGFIVGYALLCAMQAQIDGRDVPALALWPVCVRPTEQRRGIGRRLVLAALGAARVRGAEAVIAVGDAWFFCGAGFSMSRAAVLASSPVAAELQAIELLPGALSGTSGRAIYPSAYALLT